MLLIHAAVNGLLQRFSLHFQACFGNHTVTAIKKTAYLPHSHLPSEPVEIISAYLSDDFDNLWGGIGVLVTGGLLGMLC
ncbi:hypothetical protein JNO12_06790 [Erwinia aphidicola]|nr:hypothetical protein [Erwinia aphidicola]